MRILLINHYTGSVHHGMEYRPYYMAREWVNSNHKVMILAASQSHVRTIQPTFQGKQFDELIDGIHYTWYRTPKYVGNSIGRVWNISAFLHHLWRDGNRIAREFHPDLVIASSTYPMDIWPACRIARACGAKLVFEVHDLWPLTPIELGRMSRRHPFIVLAQAAEDYAYRHADVVVSLLPKALDYMRSRGLSENRFHYVPNGIDPTEWSVMTPLPDEIQQRIADVKGQGKIIVGYAGAHGIANALDSLLKAAKWMDDKFIFILVGDGPEKPRLSEHVQQERLKNVIFFNAVKKAHVPTLLASFDIAYIGMQKQSLYRFGISPNKLMDYMMAGKPVLLAIDAGNDPVSESQCGLSIPPEDPQAIANGLRSLASLGKEELAEMGTRGREYIIRHHTYPVLAQKFLDACGAQEERT